jgi:ABC-2 type transport system ATP-binding protein
MRVNCPLSIGVENRTVGLPAQNLTINQQANQMENTKNLESNSRPAISVRNLKKSYGEGKEIVDAVSDVSFEIERGKIVGILGPNGAGKTTTIKSILSLIIPTNGTVEISGEEVSDNPSEIYENVSAVLEGARNTYWRLTVRENLDFFAAISGESHKETSRSIENLIERLGLTEKSDTVVRELSRGQKQKVSIACALVRNTKILFLDEPTLGLDVKSSRDLQSELQKLSSELERTVVLSSHDMDVVQNVCDRVIIMNHGEVVADDSVENLTGLLNRTVFEVSIENQNRNDIQTLLSRKFDVREVIDHDETTDYKVEVRSNQFYELVKSLENSGASINSFTEQKPDLEDVFLDITDEKHQLESADYRRNFHE